MDSIKKTDVSALFTTDSFYVSLKDSVYLQKRNQPLGCIDSNYQRLYIHFSSVKKNPENPLQYICSGATRVQNIICHFNGTLEIENATSMANSYSDFNRHFAALVFNVKLFEDSTEFESGVFSGKLSSNCYFKNGFEILYNGLNFNTDNFSNNLFTGQWQNYSNGATKICRWGDYRIPNSDDLDVGSDNFSVNDRYINNGWLDYMDAWGTSGDATKTQKARDNEARQWWLP